jgi:cytochrome c-type biogenesis protein CcmE
MTVDYSKEENSGSTSNIKFIVGGLLIIAAVFYLIVSSTQANAQYFLTIDELNSKDQSVLEKDLRISGAVIGNSIEYDQHNLQLSFTIAHIPGNNDEIEQLGGLAKVLHEAVSSPKNSTVNIVYNGPKPDLLRDEAQAIVTGRLKDDGVFYADEVLMKCPTKYDEAVPEQVER